MGRNVKSWLVPRSLRKNAGVNVGIIFKCTYFSLGWLGSYIAKG